MRTFNKKVAVVVLGAVALTGTGVAYAYWTTTGSGTGSAATTVGEDENLSFDQAAITDMYPGDTEQVLTVTVTNDSTTQKVYVDTVKAYLTVSGTCTPGDFLLDGAAAPGDALTAIELAWGDVELDALDSQDATSSLQFNNLNENQDDCKDADVTVHYLAS